MQIQHNSHLSYCSNIHPGESWPATLANLREYTTQIRDHFGTPFGIGLRLSNAASMDLAQPEQLNQFKDWLEAEQLYVFTLNGFPYGGFHRQVVKEQVHAPDWTTPERVSYTKRLFDILSRLQTEGQEGGISTSPLSYRFWHQDPDQPRQVSCRHLIEIVKTLIRIKEKTGQSLHLDIEPEPDGILETSQEFIDYYQNYLLRQGLKILVRDTGMTRSAAEAAIREHLQLCHDVCHFAVGFEKPQEVADRMNRAGIGTGKIQISAALSADLKVDAVQQELLVRQLRSFDEPTYLHQAVLRSSESAGKLIRYPDLGPALEALRQGGFEEIRTHFHVPIFAGQYQSLQPTQQDIIETLNIWKKEPFTHHLEVETYTWEVLPEELKLEMAQSIIRELDWVKKELES